MERLRQDQGLAGLREVNRRVVRLRRMLGSALGGPERVVTLDVDAPLVETAKAEAKVSAGGG